MYAFNVYNYKLQQQAFYERFMLGKLTIIHGRLYVVV